MQTNNLNGNALTADSGTMTEHKFPWKWNLTDLANVKKNGCTVFSCFSCGGGSSMGYKLAGYELLGNCEIDSSVMKVYQVNHHPKYPFLMDIRDFLDKEKPAELYDLDILDGSPPCSVFSQAGKREEGWNVEKQFREGQKMQRLDDLFFWFIKLIDQLKPKVSIAENVTGLLAGNAKGYVNEIIKAYHEAGYTVQLFKLNAAKMGVPQRRERVFFIAHRNDIDLPKLKLSFNEPPILFKEIRSESGKEWANENAISKMRLMVRKPGDKDISSIMKNNNQKETSFQYGVIADNDVAPTLAASGSMARMYDGKNISDTDIIHMQTFPEDYNFLNQSPKYICGMSVPPVMMAQISSQVYDQWLRRLK